MKKNRNIIQNLEKNYRKYRWFFTSTGKLVIGGKSAEQNDLLLREIKESGRNFVIMHTSNPGSPFCVILTDLERATEQDQRECAIFTACFSKAWKEARKEAGVDIFSSSQLLKDKKMKQGTWGALGKVEKITVSLELALTKQKNILKAVPESSVKDKKNILVKIQPGNIPKEGMLKKLESVFGRRLNKEELLSALPSGGFKIYEKKNAES